MRNVQATKQTNNKCMHMEPPIRAGLHRSLASPPMHPEELKQVENQQSPLKATACGAHAAHAFVSNRDAKFATLASGAVSFAIQCTIWACLYSCYQFHISIQAGSRCDAMHFVLALHAWTSCCPHCIVFVVCHLCLAWPPLL
jgi:hypothetical protein